VIAYPVVHGRVGHALELVGLALHFSNNLHRRILLVSSGDLRHPVIQTVQLLPHHGAKRLANLRGVIPRRRNRRNDRRPVLPRHRQFLNGFLRIQLLHLLRQPDMNQRSPPSFLSGRTRRIQRQIPRRFQHPRAIVRALQIRAMVTAEEKAKGDRIAKIDPVRDYFYRGPIAKKTGAYSEANGGLVTYNDIAAFHARVDRPRSTVPRLRNREARLLDAGPCAA
jgi:Gamma-glutamyltranspeptidase